MYHPQLTLRLARERADDLRRAADSRAIGDARAAVAPQPRQRLADALRTVTLRIAFPDDAQALAGLAELDGAQPLGGPVLIAEVEDSPTAAMSLSDFRAIANPYEPTDALIQLLMVRARQLHGPERSRRPRLARLRACFQARSALEPDRDRRPEMSKLGLGIAPPGPPHHERSPRVSGL